MSDVKRTYATDDEIAPCPACGAKIDELWDYFTDREDATIAPCPACGVKILISREITTEYTLRYPVARGG